MGLKPTASSKLDLVKLALHLNQFSKLYWPIYYSFSLQAPLATQLPWSTTTLTKDQNSLKN